MGAIDKQYEGVTHEGVFNTFPFFVPTLSSTGTKESTPVAGVSVLAMVGGIHDH